MACPTCAQHPSAQLYTQRFCPICARLRHILRLDALRSIWRRGGPLWRWNEPVAHELDAHCACAAHCFNCADAVFSAPASAWVCGAQCICCAMRLCTGCAYAPKRLCLCAWLQRCAWGQRSWKLMRYCASHGCCASASDMRVAARMPISAHAHPVNAALHTPT